MNKKGLIFIFLFLVSAVGAVNITEAATDNQVEINFKYIPSAYVPMGEVYVEFDSRFLDDSNVIGQNDDLYFAFFYDVAVEAYFGGAVTYGGGAQPDNWFYDPQNLSSVCQYTETRVVGAFNVYLDNIDMGVSNFDIAVDNGNYQEIKLKLDIGWHYLTIVAAELVSDCNRTMFWWEYAKDEKKFYVAEDKKDIPTLAEDALYNDVSMTTTAVNSEDLGQWYNWTSWLDSPRPVAESTANQYATDDLGTEAVPITTDIAVQWNASDTVLNWADGAYGWVVYDNIYEMGPSTYVWFVNNQPVDAVNETYTPDTITGLQQGQNWVYFVLFGFRVDDYSQLYGEPLPQLAVDSVVYSVFLGEVPPEPTTTDPCPDCPECTECEECIEPTPGFGILISVSMLGLAAVLILVRRRK